jgi:eukaryotic-like serine/threonine-protein kinase
MTLLDNRYQVTRELGEGAFGKTYIAIDTRSPSQRQCVVKQLKLVATPDQNRFYQSLFEREAVVLEQVGNRSGGRIPNLLAYFRQDGDHFFVMDFIPGRTLAQCIAEGGKQKEATVRVWLAKILEALDFLHQFEYRDGNGDHKKGLIHRDIKPENIIIREDDGSPVLIDFGVVKEVEAGSKVRSDGTLTKAVGTAYYMPMEQQNGHPVPASDLFSLGITAIVALTGKSPGELYDPQDSSFGWRQFAPMTSLGLADVLDRATRPLVKDRFQSAREMSNALNSNQLETSPMGSNPNVFLNPTQAAPKPPSVTGVISQLESASNGRRAVSKQPFLSVGVVLLLVVFGGGLATWYAVTSSKKNDVSPTGNQTPKKESKPLPATGKIGDSIKLPSGIEVVYIPAGEFQMGSPTSEGERLNTEFSHRVGITQPFWLGKFEVTQAQWESVMGFNPSNFKDCAECPVENVSWNDCQEFIRKLNAKGDGNTYALPTEAQWEYACRAGTTTPFSFGATITPEQVNYDGSFPYGNAAEGLYRQKTVPVGSLNRPNAWGLNDMHGNVFEWCADRYDWGYYKNSPVNDPKGPKSGESCVTRGGSWNRFASMCRSAYRLPFPPGDRNSLVGVRVVVFPGRTT